MGIYTNGTQFEHGETEVTRDVLASIQRIWLQRRPHINGAGAECCEGCGLARQIPWLLDLIDHLKTEPVAAETSVEYAVWCYDADPESIVLSERHFVSVSEAEDWASAHYGRYGVTGHRLMQREHHRYPKGSRFAVSTTDWEPVPYEVLVEAEEQIQ